MADDSTNTSVQGQADPNASSAATTGQSNSATADSSTADSSTGSVADASTADTTAANTSSQPDPNASADGATASGTTASVTTASVIPTKPIEHSHKEGFLKILVEDEGELKESFEKAWKWLLTDLGIEQAAAASTASTDTKTA